MATSNKWFDLDLAGAEVRGTGTVRTTISKESIDV